MKKSNLKRSQHNNQQYVLTVAPGKRSEIMTLRESKDILGRFAQYEKVSMVPTFDLMMVYDERAVLPLGDEVYLTGAAIIYAPMEDGCIRSLTLEDKQLASRIMEMRTVTLWADGKEFPAFHL